mgnify:CR=1 FL=1
MKIICIGRNYVDHAKELGNQVPENPVIFMKPETALIPKKMPFFIPDFSKDVHHEIELVVRINRLGKHIHEEFAHKYYQEIGLGIDFTARDLQSELKSKGLPWEKAKAFDGSAFVSPFLNIQKKSLDPHKIQLSLRKNGELVQDGNTKDLLFPIDRLISYVSRYFTLKIGDLIFTGTPAGVGPVQANDLLEGYLEGNKQFSLRVK